MKTLKFFPLFLFTIFIISSCTSEDSIMGLVESTAEDTDINATTRNGYGLDEPYIVRPDLDPYSTHNDTTDFWVLDVKVNKYINGTYYYGKKGLYTQLQYTTIKYAYESDWKNAVVLMENPIYLRKENYPFEDIYFRARTMSEEKFSKIEGSKQYQYASDLSPWSAPLYARNNIYNKDGISLTKNNIILDINFIFYASYTGYLWEKDLSNFTAAILYGNTSQYYKVQNVYNNHSGYREKWTVSIDKQYIKNYGNTISIVNQTSPIYNISFNPQIFTVSTNWNEITPPISVSINVDLW